MPRIVQFRRGTDAQVLATTPAEGELIVNLEKNTLHVGDGVTQGGFALISEAQDTGQTVAIATLETEMDAAEGRLDGAEASLVSQDGRIVTLETTNIWESSNDTRYLQIVDSYDKTQTDQLVTNQITTLQTSLTSIYALQTDTYTKLQVEDRISVRIDDYMQNDLDLSLYRLVADSYSSAEVDTTIASLSQTYYSKVETDAMYRRLDDSYSRAEVDSDLADIRNNTYTKTEVDGSITSVRNDHVLKTDPLMDLAKKVDISESPTEVIFDFCKMGY
jgi:hypothetical protein